jgi:hypothetical protein
MSQVVIDGQVVECSRDDLRRWDAQAAEENARRGGDLAPEDRATRDAMAAAERGGRGAAPRTPTKRAARPAVEEG